MSLNWKPLPLALLGVVLLSDFLPSPAWAQPKDRKKENGTPPIQASVSTWRESAQNGGLQFKDAFPDKDWWVQFQDPILTGYIQKALIVNHKLAIAENKIKEARAMADRTFASQLPQISLAPNFTRQTYSQNSPSFGRGSRFTINLYQLPIQASYEMDIWGKNRDRTSAAKKGVAAAEQDYRAASVLVATEVATAYFNLIKADKLIALTDEMIRLSDLDINQAKARWEAGLTTDEPLKKAEEQRSVFRASREQAERLRGLALGQMGLLMGMPSAELADLPRQNEEAIPLAKEIEAGIPAQVVERRPDIQAVEARLQQSQLGFRSARKDFLPSLVLGGNAGYGSIQMSNLLTGGSVLASTTNTLSQPLFDGGLRKATMKMYKAQMAQQQHAYHQAFLNAFKEVEDALASLKANHQGYDEANQRVASLDSRLKLENLRAETGLLTKADVIPTQLARLNAEQARTESKIAALVDQLSLYKALGGGF